MRARVIVSPLYLSLSDLPPFYRYAERKNCDERWKVLVASQASASTHTCTQVSNSSEEMSNVLRLCNPYEMNIVWEYDTKTRKMKGLIASPMNELVNYLSSKLNVSYEIRSIQDGVGELVDSSGRFDGCIGLLQRNESDLMVREATYPSKALNIGQGEIFADSTIVILTPYSPIDELEPAQMTSAFASFDRAVWLLCLLTCLVCCLALQASEWLEVKRRHCSLRPKRPSGEADSNSILYRVTAHMYSVGEIGCSSGVFNKILYGTLSLFSFLVLFYFGSIIKTERVVIKPPDTIRSYQDLIDKKIGIGFLMTSDTYIYFKFARNGSIEKRLWDVTASKLTEQDMLFDAGKPNLMARGLKLVMKRKQAFITESLWAPLAIKQACSIVFDEMRLAIASAPPFSIPSARPRTLIPLVGRDENANVIMKGFLTSGDQGKLLTDVRKRIRRLWQTAVPTKLIRDFYELDLFGKFTGTPQSKNTKNEDVEKCLRNELLMPEVDLKSISLSNVSHLMLGLLYIYLGLFILLVVEIYFEPLQRYFR